MGKPLTQGELVAVGSSPPQDQGGEDSEGLPEAGDTKGHPSVAVTLCRPPQEGDGGIHTPTSSFGDVPIGPPTVQTPPKARDQTLVDAAYPGQLPGLQSWAEGSGRPGRTPFTCSYKRVWEV